MDLVPQTIWRSEALDRFVKDPSVDVGIRRFTVGGGLVCVCNMVGGVGILMYVWSKVLT